MTLWRHLWIGVILVLLSACAAQQPGTAPPASQIEQTRPATLKLAELPCAETATTEILRVSYPGTRLYRSGAALPSQEGLKCLEALSEWLKTNQGAGLLITVSGEEGHAFDALALAAKRRELLERYFVRQGIDIGSWQWATEEGVDVQLQITEIN